MTEKSEAILTYVQADAVLRCACGQRIEFSSNDEGPVRCPVCRRAYKLAWGVYRMIAEGEHV